MNVLKKLNQSEWAKPYNGLSTLTVGYHKVVGFRESIGKAYGKSIIAELKDEIIFLPQYIAEKLDAEDISDLNNCEESIYLYFGGKNKNKYWILRIVSEAQMIQEINEKKKQDNSDDGDTTDDSIDYKSLMNDKEKPDEEEKKLTKKKKAIASTSLYCEEALSEEDKPTKKKKKTKNE